MLSIDYNENIKIMNKLNKLIPIKEFIIEFVNYKKSIKEFDEFKIDDENEILLNMINNIKFNNTNYYYDKNNELKFDIDKIENEIIKICHNSIFNNKKLKKIWNDLNE